MNKILSRASEICGTISKVLTQLEYQTERREIEAQKNICRNSGKKLPNIGDRHKFRNSVSSANFQTN